MEPGSAQFALDGAGGRYQLSGSAGMETARALLERGLALFGAEPRVEVDLSGVTGADGAGLAVLLAWVGRARAAGQVLSFKSLPAPLVALARVCGVEAMLAAAAGGGASAESR